MFLPDADPQPWLERNAASMPLWARIAALHLSLFPRKANGRVQLALRKWGMKGAPLFCLRYRNGLRWLIDMRMQPQYAAYLSPLAIEGADSHLIHALSALARPGDCVADIGANRGFFTILLRRLVGASGAVLAVEPLPLTRTFLTANLRLNGCDDVLVCPFGLSDAEGEADIAFQPNALGRASLHPDVAFNAATEVQHTRIALRRFDRILAEAKTPPLTIMKVDVEGHEFAALQGAEQTLRSAQPLILFEAWPQYTEQAGGSLEAIEKFLTDCAPYRFAAVRWAEGAPYFLDSPLQWDAFQSVASDLVAWIPERHQERITAWKRASGGRRGRG